MEKKKFATAPLDPEHEIFAVHIGSLSSTPLVVSLGSTLLNVRLSQRSQISDLIAKEASTKVLDEYVNFTNVFFSDLAS